MTTGLDAPTHESARREPFPALLRIQKEAILPNRFRADIKECFLIAAGYGDLSSERAYLRGETISCVREDGGVIETRLDSYAVGEDGKAFNQSYIDGEVMSRHNLPLLKTKL
ncbi:TraB/VirB10 family protein [Bacillus sp. LS15-K4]|nr:TraB/VirB10 family protein [Bacillus sp. LS15-K4]